MDTEALLQKLINETDGPLALAETELRAAEEKVARLRAERYGLELALARHRGDPAPRQRADVREGDEAWLSLDRTEATERVLLEGGGPMHRKAVRMELLRHGRDDSLNAVSAALAYLGGKGRVIGKGQGLWVHPSHDDQPARAEDEDPPIGDEDGDTAAESSEDRDGPTDSDDGRVFALPSISYGEEEATSAIGSRHGSSLSVSGGHVMG